MDTPNPSESERRKLPRKKASSYFEVRVHDTNDLIGMLVDLNVGGLRVYTEKKVEIGRFQKLRINLPKPVMNMTQIVFGAVSKWCCEAEEPGCHHAGFELRNLSQLDRELIEKVTASRSFGKMKSKMASAGVYGI
jgi:c-di-GMP-binding flagellar brake protein YcgR